MRLVVINRLGTVHRQFANGATCVSVERAQKTREVTPLQCLVFGLACCAQCFPSNDEYLRVVHGPSRGRVSA